MIGVEAGGHGLRSGKHAASIQGGTVGVLHGSKSYVLAGRARPDHRNPFGCGRAWTIPASARSSAICAIAAASNLLPRPIAEAIAAIKLLAEDRRDHPCAGKRPCHRRGDALGAALAANGRSSSSISPGRGDKDMLTVGDYLGVKL